MTTDFSVHQAPSEPNPNMGNSEEITAAQMEAARLAAWMRDQAKIHAFFNNPGTYIGQYWQQYKPIFALVGYLILGLIALNLVLTIVGFVVNLPLVGSLLELIGIGYSIWFTNRYLLSAEKRQEFTQQVKQLKEEILGDKDETSAIAAVSSMDAASSTDQVALETDTATESTLVNSL